MYRFILAIALAVAAQLTAGQNLLAVPPNPTTGGNFSLNLVAAAPFTYDHSTGGGAYDDRTIGKDKDVVESLEGGDFACLDLVTHFVQISVDPAAVGTQTIQMVFEWTADSTGQSGVAYEKMYNVIINRGDVLVGEGTNPTGSDAGNVENPADSNVSIIVNNPGVTFSKGAKGTGTVTVSGLQAGEKVVLRFDLKIVCNGDSPTGNLQASLASAKVIEGGSGAIGSGAQTIPLKNVGDIKPCDPKVCPPTCDPKTEKCP